MRGEQEPLLQPGRSGEGRARPRLTRRVCLDALGGVIMVAFVCSLLIWHMREEGTEKQASCPFCLSNSFGIPHTYIPCDATSCSKHGMKRSTP
eukprot:1285502-Rhodomonas_salina.2